MQPDIYRIISIGEGSISAMAKPQSGDQIEEVFGAIAASGVTKIVSLLEIAEAQSLGLKNEKQLCESNGMRFVQFSMPDLAVPLSVNEFCDFVKQQYVDALGGDSVLVHCRAGIGRTGMVTASVLMHAGYKPLAAFDWVSRKRGVPIPDLQEQVDWVVEHQLQILSA